MAAQSPYLTVKQAATELGISDDGVRKLIRNGKLRAIKRSERKTLIPRPAFCAYQRKLNGVSIQPNGLKTIDGTLADRSAAFKRDAAMSPQAWLDLQIRDGSFTYDTAEGMGLTVSAYGLVSEGQAAGLVVIPVRPCVDTERLRASSRALLAVGLAA
jgi:excisionase family DNA binding protein